MTEDLKRLEADKSRMQFESESWQRSFEDKLVIPPTNELRQMFSDALNELAVDSYEFADLMRRIIPTILVFPHRLCGGHRIVMRAQMKLKLAHLLPDARLQAAVDKPLERILWVDLFDPPQREAFRKRIVADRRHMTEAAVTVKYGLTVTAAQAAAALQRQMDALGLTDPYIRVTEPPADFGKIRRHRHSRYRFDPLPGAGEL